MEELVDHMDGLTLPETGDDKVCGSDNNPWPLTCRYELGSGWFALGLYAPGGDSGQAPEYNFSILHKQGKQQVLEDEEDSNPCAICLNTTALEDVAILPGCDHVYCGEALPEGASARVSWRAECLALVVVSPRVDAPTS